MIRSVRKQINRSLILMTSCSASLVVAEGSDTTDQQGHVPVNESELFENLLDESGLQEDSEGLMTEPLPGTIDLQALRQAARYYPLSGSLTLPG